MPESIETTFMRWRFNWFPAFRGTGARITYIAADWREVRIRLPLSWRTRNYVGTIYGGSMYAAVDPFYMVMLIKALGPGYVVWDKAASIRFKKPGTAALSAVFLLSDAEIDAIKAALSRSPSCERSYTVDLVDAEGIVHASVDKIVYIRARDAGHPDGPDKTRGGS